MKYVTSTPEKEDDMEVPLSKALGVSIFKNLENNLQNDQINQEYMTQYNEMLKVSQEAVARIGDEDGEIGTDLNRLKDIIDRRRSVHMRSAIGRRRSRSQALRREKLNSQSLRSHLQHSKQATSSQEQEINY